MLEEVCRPQEAHRGLGWAEGERNLLFYEDDGRITGRYPYWVHNTLGVTVEMFGRVGLDRKLEKTKAIICTPGFICVYTGNEAYKHREMGEGETFWERKQTRVSCS